MKTPDNRKSNKIESIPVDLVKDLEILDQRHKLKDLNNLYIEFKEKYSSVLENIGMIIETPPLVYADTKKPIKKDDPFLEEEVSGFCYLHIANPELFKEYLTSLNKENLDKDTKFFLVFFLKKMSEQVIYLYNTSRMRTAKDVDDVDSNFVNFLGVMGSMSKQYELIGLDKEIELKKYIDILKKLALHKEIGSLSEYILFYKLLEENIEDSYLVGCFYVSYIKDKEKFWGDNFFSPLEDIAQFVKENKIVKELYQEVLNYGLKCINIVMADKKNFHYNKEECQDIKMKIENLLKIF
ncbi:MAG: hypothetical protein K9L98_03385 [Candidatus Pacebacteria bacterium]|nr:hypothetical protein [Candidatus Paceibacterota bacterium]MCF7863021.1 hypothetical protein [Candidatus Paceibacterota bacterium]